MRADVEIVEAFVCPRCGGEREIIVSEHGFSVGGNAECDRAHRDEEFSGMWTAYDRCLELGRSMDETQGEGA